MWESVHEAPCWQTASQSQAKGQPEGQLHGNLRNRVMETHVELLRNRFQQHPPGTHMKEYQYKQKNAFPAENAVSAVVQSEVENIF